MRRLLTLSLAVSLLALPSAALAQNAGDEQYSDPFGQTDEQSGSQGEPTQAPEPAPAPAQTGQDTGATETGTVAQADAPTLPATGLPAGLLAGTGALLLAGGTTLRRRVS